MYCSTPILGLRYIIHRDNDIVQVDKEVGEAIRESSIPRSEIFVTSKFGSQFSRPENVELCLDQILTGMGLDYIDLYLAHWPCAHKPISQEALNNAKAGPEGPDISDGTMEVNDNPVIDWEYTSENLARQAGQLMIA